MAKLDTFRQWVKDGEEEAQLATIQSLAMQGVTREAIAGELGIGTRTLFDMINKYPVVSAAMKSGRRHVVVLIQRKLMDKVKEGDTAAIIYALKVYGGEFFNDRKAMKMTAEVSSNVDGTVSAGVQIYLPQKDEEEGQE